MDSENDSISLRRPLCDRHTKGVDRFRKSGRRYFDDGDPVFAAIAIKLDSGGPAIFRSAVFLSAAICAGSRPGLSRPTRLP